MELNDDGAYTCEREQNPANSQVTSEIAPDGNNPSKTQVGGSHYARMVIQPLEYCMANKLDACQTKVIKYVSREKGDKAKKLEDLDKAIHVLNYYKEWIINNV